MDAIKNWVELNAIEKLLNDFVANTKGCKAIERNLSDAIEEMKGGIEQARSDLSIEAGEQMQSDIRWLRKQGMDDYMMIPAPEPTEQQKAVQS